MAEHWKYPERFMASDKQLWLLRKLAAERRIDLDRGLRLRWAVDIDDLDNASASTAIDLVKAGEFVPMYRTVRS